MSKQPPPRLSQRSSRSRTGTYVDDRATVVADLVRLIWQHKLWWLLPLVLVVLILGVLLAIETTPIGPLLYPVF